MKDIYCKQVLGLQWADSVTITSLAGATNTTTVTLQKGRGYICGMHILMDYATVLLGIGSQINILVNGVLIVQNVDASFFANQYNNATPFFVPFLTPGGVDLQVTFSNASAGTQSIAVIPHYNQNPELLKEYGCEQSIGLRLQSGVIALGAGARSDAQVTLDTGRGFVKGFYLTTTFAAFTDSTLINVNRVSLNGVSILENVNGLQLSQQYNNSPPYYQAQTPGGVTFDAAITNGSGTVGNAVFVTCWSQNKDEQLNY